jgi:hypothetical protein
MSARSIDLQNKKASVNPARLFVKPPFVNPVVESLENRCLLSGTITLVSGTVTVTGTTVSDTIAGGTNPANTSQYFFLVQTAGQPTVEDFFAKTSVTAVNIFMDPVGSTPTGTNNDLLNLGGANLGPAVAIQGGEGSDTLIGQLGPNQINTGIGTSRNQVQGSLGDDTIVSNGSNDTIRSGGGHDTIQANSGNNILVGGKDGSQLIAGDGWDTLRSGRGNATLHGSQTTSSGTLMLGGFGNDFLDGRGSSNDTMIAGSGIETLIAGSGTYFMDAGWDSFVTLQGGSALPVSTGSDSVDGSLGTLDTIVSSAGTPTLMGSNASNVWGLNNPSATTSNIQTNDFVAQNDTVNPSGATTLTVHLTIVNKNGANMNDVVIPLGAGHTPTGTSAVRATDAIGTIVFQTNTARTFTLADFFNHWGVAFNSVGIGQFVASPGSGHTLTMTVNGVANTQFQNYQVHDGDTIVVTFNT